VRAARANGVPLAEPLVSWAQLFAGAPGGEALLEFDMTSTPTPWEVYVEL
jgi:hypothetical protein